MVIYFLVCAIQVNLDMKDSMGPGKLVRHMQNPSYTYDEYLICIGLGPSISSVICKNLSYSGPSYPSSPVLHKLKSILPLQNRFAWHFDQLSCRIYNQIYIYLDKICLFVLVIFHDNLKYLLHQG